MNFDDVELEIALLALRDCADRALAFAGLPGGYSDIKALGGVPRRCCEHVAHKLVALIARIEQQQKDQVEEMADAG